MSSLDQEIRLLRSLPAILINIKTIHHKSSNMGRASVISRFSRHITAADNRQPMVEIRMMYMDIVEDHAFDIPAEFEQEGLIIIIVGSKWTEIDIVENNISVVPAATVEPRVHDESKTPVRAGDIPYHNAVNSTLAVTKNPDSLIRIFKMDSVYDDIAYR